MKYVGLNLESGGFGIKTFSDISMSEFFNCSLVLNAQGEMVINNGDFETPMWTIKEMMRVLNGTTGE